MYAWSSEVFATICAAIFFPVNLEQLARLNGVYAFDRTTPCTVDLGNITDPHTNSTLFFTALATGAVALEDKSRCVIHFLGITWMDSSSFALYTFSISTFLQTILVISMSGAADYGITFRRRSLMVGNFRKTFLLLFNSVSLAAALGFGVVAALGPSVYLLASLCAISANVNSHNRKD
jgi:MFS transporter, UMF1 family